MTEVKLTMLTADYDGLVMALENARDELAELSRELPWFTTYMVDYLANCLEILESSREDNK